MILVFAGCAGRLGEAQLLQPATGRGGSGVRLGWLGNHGRGHNRQDASPAHALAPSVLQPGQPGCAAGATAPRLKPLLSSSRVVGITRDYQGLPGITQGLLEITWDY